MRFMDVIFDRKVSEKTQKKTFRAEWRDGSDQTDFQGQKGRLSLESRARGSGPGLEGLASSKRS
jgi:hypothetical protein